jgi:hypothetical protein
LPRLMILLNMADWEAGGGGSTERSANNSFLFLWDLGIWLREGGGRLLGPGGRDKERGEVGSTGQVRRRRERRRHGEARMWYGGRRRGKGINAEGKRKAEEEKWGIFLFTFFPAYMKFVFMGGVYLVFCELFDFFFVQMAGLAFLVEEKIFPVSLIGLSCFHVLLGEFHFSLASTISLVLRGEQKQKCGDVENIWNKL